MHIISAVAVANCLSTNSQKLSGYLLVQFLVTLMDLKEELNDIGLRGYLGTQTRLLLPMLLKCQPLHFPPSIAQGIRNVVLMKRTAAAGRVRGSSRMTGAKLMQRKDNLGSSSLTLKG